MKLIIHTYFVLKLQNIKKFRNQSQQHFKAWLIDFKTFSKIRVL